MAPVKDSNRTLHSRGRGAGGDTLGQAGLLEGGSAMAGGAGAWSEGEGDPCSGVAVFGSSHSAGT